MRARKKTQLQKDKVQMWVFPDFRDMLKRQALNKGMDVLSLTERMAKSDLDDEDDIFEPITKTFKRLL